MSEQSRYWNELVFLKRDAVYMRFYAEQSERFDRSVEIIKAVAGVGSLGSWAIFQTYPFIWSTIIVLSQLLTALKDVLPYKTTLKATSVLANELDLLALQAEADWFGVANGQLDEEQIHNLRMSFKRHVNAVERESFGVRQLATNAKLVAKANLVAENYFATYNDE